MLFRALESPDVQGEEHEEEYQGPPHPGRYHAPNAGNIYRVNGLCARDLSTVLI